MTAKRVFAALTLLLFLIGMTAVCTDKALAADEVRLTDKKGISGLFAGKGPKADRAPSKAQKYLGWGSLLVMIIVIKYL